MKEIKLNKYVRKSLITGRQNNLGFSGRTGIDLSKIKFINPNDSGIVDTESILF
jgi:hypothetical protein